MPWFKCAGSNPGGFPGGDLGSFLTFAYLVTPSSESGENGALPLKPNSETRWTLVFFFFFFLEGR